MIQKSETTISRQVFTLLFDNTSPCLVSGHIRMSFSVSDLNTSCFLQVKRLYRDSHHSSHEALLCFALTASLPKPNPLLQDSAHAGCGMWEVGASPAAAPLGWCVPRRGLEAGTREMLSPLLWILLASPTLCLSLPFQQSVSS